MVQHRQKQPSRFAGFAPPKACAEGDQLGTLFVLGLSVEVACDDHTAQLLEEERHLMPLFGNKDCLVDRYDARLLLEQPPAEPCQPYEELLEPGLAALGGSQAELEHERYRDLDYTHEHLLEQPYGVALPIEPPPFEQSFSEAEEAAARDQGVHPVGYWRSEDGSGSDDDNPLLPPPPRGNAYAFDYGDTGHADDTPAGHSDFVEGPVADMVKAEDATGGSPAPEWEAERAADVAPYIPRYAVPAHLLPCVPPTERLHKIVMQTAKFVRENGGQVEVLLRVKQAGNPTFSFLFPGSAVFPYYRWLVETNPQELVRDAAPGASTPQSVVPARQPADLGQPHHALQNTAGSDQGQQDVGVAAQGPAATSPPPSNTEPHALGLLGMYGEDDEDDDGGSTDDSLHDYAASSGHESALPVYGPAWPGGVGALVGQRGPRGPARVEDAGALPLQDSSAPGPAAISVPPSPEGSEPGVPGLEDEAQARSVSPAPQPHDCVPPEARAIIDKLVAFVQKNGTKFEALVREREKGNAKFGFLHPLHPHHQYYRSQLAVACGVDVLAGLHAAAAVPATAVPHHSLFAPTTASVHPAATALPAPAAGSLPPVTRPPPWQLVAATPVATVTTAPAAATAATSTTSPAAARAADAKLQEGKPVSIKANPRFASSKLEVLSVAAEKAAGPSQPKHLGVDAVSDLAASVQAVPYASVEPAVDAPNQQQHAVQCSSHHSSPSSSDSMQGVTQQQMAGQLLQVAAAPLADNVKAPSLSTADDGEGSVEERLQQRRQRARQLLAARASSAAAQRQEQGVRAIRHHRHFFLREDDVGAVGADNNHHRGQSHVASCQQERASASQTCAPGTASADEPVDMLDTSRAHVSIGDHLAGPKRQKMQHQRPDGPAPLSRGAQAVPMDPQQVTDGNASGTDLRSRIRQLLGARLQ